MQQDIKKVLRVLPGLKSEEPKWCRQSLCVVSLFVFIIIIFLSIVLVIGIGISKAI